MELDSFVFVNLHCLPIVMLSCPGRGKIHIHKTQINNADPQSYFVQSIVAALTKWSSLLQQTHHADVRLPKTRHDLDPHPHDSDPQHPDPDPDPDPQS
jgi:hypothetical protein